MAQRRQRGGVVRPFFKDTGSCVNPLTRRGCRAGPEQIRAETAARPERRVRPEAGSGASSAGSELPEFSLLPPIVPLTEHPEPTLHGLAAVLL